MKGHCKIQVAVAIAVVLMTTHSLHQVAEMSQEMSVLFGAFGDTLSITKAPTLFQDDVRNLMRSESRQQRHPMSSVTWPKLFPLDDPIPSSFITDLPFEPWFANKNCRVEFKEKNTALCSMQSSNVFEDRIGMDLVVRLLEHRFECKASHLVVVPTGEGHPKRDKCMWIPPVHKSLVDMKRDTLWNGGAVSSTMIEDSGIDGIVFLLPFLFSNFYAPITHRIGYNPTMCFVPGNSSMGPLPPNITIITLDRDWRTVLEQARWCDFIASASKTGLVIADALGVPAIAMAANISSSHHVSNDVGDVLRDNLYSPPRHREHSLALERHDVKRAEQQIETFPFHLFTTTSTKAKKKGDALSHRPDKVPKNTTLVIVLGNLRGGETTWHSMYHHLLDENQADLALMIGAGGNTTLSPYARAKYVWEFPEYDDWADAIDLIDRNNATNWRTTVEPHVMKKSGVLGGVKGHTGSGAIIFMARHWLLEHIARLNLTERYDRFVLTRSDYFYSCSHPLSVMDPRFLWVPSGEDYGGVTDRHWVMNRHHIVPALRVFENLILHHERFFRGTLATSPELLIRATWIMESLYPHQVRRFPRMMYTCFVDGVDGTRWKNQKKKWGISEHGVQIKYVAEHQFASCFCGGGHVRDANNKSLGEFTNSWQVWNCLTVTVNGTDGKISLTK